MHLILHLFLPLLLAPLLVGVIVRTKAVLAGRVGAPLLQPYYDLSKLLRKGSVFSSTTTWVFCAGPVVGLAAVLTAVLLMPLGGSPAPCAFAGDMILLAYLLGLARFFTVVAALDTGSAFEGMGAAREVTFACLAEPALFFGLLVLTRLSGTLSLSDMLANPLAGEARIGGAALVLVAAGWFILLLAENARIPFDDPNTHLELTMIHEVMVLDHSGPALGLILYSAALKLFLYGALLVQVLVPFRTGNAGADAGLFFLGLLLLSVLIGVVESVMARLRLVQVPNWLLAAVVLPAFAIVLLVTG